jgi:molecular chaperone DnaK
MNWMADQFLADTAIDLRQDRLALQRLKEVAERAKCELCDNTKPTSTLPFIAADSTGPKHFNKTLTRDEFEELVKDLVEQTIEPCHTALRTQNFSVATSTK